MKATVTCTFQGPSVYAQHPVVRFGLRGLSRLVASPADRNLLDELCSRLPELRTHPGSGGAPECFANPGAGELLPIAHLFEHICIVLQNRVGAELTCMRTGASGHIDPRSATVPYEEAEVCIEAARLAADLLTSLAAAGPDATGPRGIDFPARLGKFASLAARAMLPIQDRMLVRTARKLGIPSIRVVGRMLVLGQGRFQRRVSGTKTSLTNVVGNDLAANKDYARQFLLEFGLPAPRYERVHRLREAVEAAKRIGYPVVVKPNDGNMGRGVSVRMRNRREVRDAYRRARAVCRSVLIEELVEGDDHRIIVINGKVCAATRRIPAHVVGDGVRTIEDLVSEVNRDPRRGTGHKSPWTRIQMDEQTDRLIGELGYSRQSVPPTSQVVYLRRISNDSAGGTDVDVTDEVHPDNRAIAVRAAQAIGLDIAGIDMLTKDISSSLWANGGKIGEINSQPGIRKHLWPAAGTPRDVITPILTMLFPAGATSRVPIVAVVGTGNSSIVARMLAHILTAAGRHVGMAADRRTYSGRRLSDAAGELAPPAAARRVLLDPEVDVAVLEMAPEDILRYGLGCETLDVAVIVNSGSGAPEAIEAVRVVARSTRGVVYAGESGGLASGVESACAGAGLCRVAPGGPGGRRAAGQAAVAGRRAVLQENSLAMDEPGRRRREIRLPDLATGLPGLDPGAIAECAAYASLAALSLGEEAADIYGSLSSFSLAAATGTGGRTGKPAGRDPS